MEAEMRFVTASGLGIHKQHEFMIYFLNIFAGFQRVKLVWPFPTVTREYNIAWNPRKEIEFSPSCWDIGSEV
jgi:hypothetical protein